MEEKGRANVMSNWWQGCNLHGSGEQDMVKKLFAKPTRGGEGNAKDFDNLQTNYPKKRREQTCYNAFQK